MTKQSQMETMELKSTITEMENSLEDLSNSFDLTDESYNCMKTDGYKLCSLKNRGKKRMMKMIRI